MSTKELSIPVAPHLAVAGDLQIPSDPQALVVFSHGSGSSRFSTRNRYVAEILNKQGIATLLVDLLTATEDLEYESRFNIRLLTERLLTVTHHAIRIRALKDLPLGYFGASTGAASALRAAARMPDQIRAVVSRGGRPDLADDLLANVKAPTLLLVGGLDVDVLRLNAVAYDKMVCAKELQIVKGAGHLFEEPGKLQEVAQLALAWFNRHLVLKSNPK